MPELDGKVALVTGGASGTGKATVARLCSAGASVALLDRDRQLGQAAAGPASQASSTLEG